MYNRYVPQNDGTHRRNPVSNSQHTQPRPMTSPPPSPPAPTMCPPPPQEECRQKETAGSFLKGLLPKNLDTGDLLIIILLLLLAGDNQDEKSSALLTLALYLFM